MKCLLLGLACAVCGWLSVPAVAAGQVADLAATHAYLRAFASYDIAMTAELGASLAAIEARATGIGEECPSAFLYAPRDRAFGELGEETAKAVFLAGIVPVRPLLQRVASAIARLTWSDRGLTRLARNEAMRKRAVAALVLPDVCGDIAAWKADAYAALPQSAARFLTRVHAVESIASVGPSEQAREAVMMRLLRPYEGPEERLAAKRVERLKERIDMGWATARAFESKLADALGVVAL